MEKSDRETRTPEFYQYLSSRGHSAQEIEATRAKLRNSALSEDNTTSYFVHEAANALGFVRSSMDENGQALVNWAPEDFAHQKAILLKVRQGLGWFTQVGKIPLPAMQDFLTMAEATGDWNSQIVEQLFSELNKLKASHGILPKPK